MTSWAMTAHPWWRSRARTSRSTSSSWAPTPGTGRRATTSTTRAGAARTRRSCSTSPRTGSLPTGSPSLWDSLVDRPECYTENDYTIPGEPGAIWNAAYTVGGPACTIRQFEQLTHVHVSNYVVVDFAGFKGMVDAVDGVEVCIPEDIDDDVADIHIPPWHPPARRRGGSRLRPGAAMASATAATSAGSSGSRRSSPRSLPGWSTAGRWPGSTGCSGSSTPPPSP